MCLCCFRILSRSKGRSPTVEVESDVNLGARGWVACHGRNDRRLLQGKPTAPRFSPAGANRREESGAAGGIRLSAAAELEGDFVKPGPGGRMARRGPNDHRSLQGKPPAPGFSPTDAGQGGESGAASAVSSDCRRVVCLVQVPLAQRRRTQRSANGTRRISNV